eukprot:403368435
MRRQSANSNSLSNSQTTHSNATAQKLSPQSLLQQISTPKGASAHSFFNGEMDLNYIQSVLDQVKAKLQNSQSFIDQRASLAHNDLTTLEDELNNAYGEIKTQEKQMRGIFTITEFLFETYQELQNKIEEDFMVLEDQKREIDGLEYKQNALLFELEQKTLLLRSMQTQNTQFEKQAEEKQQENQQLKSRFDMLEKQQDRDHLRVALDLESISAENLKYQEELEQIHELNEKLEANIEELNKTIESLTVSLDQKNLELKSIAQEKEELQKTKKNLTGKIEQYQVINEALRKDKKSLESERKELSKQVEQQKMISASAAFMSQGHINDCFSDEEIIRNDDLKELDDDFFENKKDQFDSGNQFYRTERVQDYKPFDKGMGLELNNSFNSEEKVKQFNDVFYEQRSNNSSPEKFNYIEIDAQQACYETLSNIEIVRKIDQKQQEISMQLTKENLLQAFDNDENKLDFENTNSQHRESISSNKSNPTAFSNPASRDVIREFFALTCQSVKLNSPHLNLICNTKTDELYNKAQSLNIPFYQWNNWLESYLHKEVLQSIFKQRMKASFVKAGNFRNNLASNNQYSRISKIDNQIDQYFVKEDKQELNEQSPSKPLKQQNELELSDKKAQSNSQKKKSANPKRNQKLIDAIKQLGKF